ncbi:MAG: radical SAM protein [Firmicutes bacterium HGW-Firmicutes-14]|nr:MAG: radical SAM protein [Firmicutes bacterium HGW-Firmicutes-14]
MILRAKTVDLLQTGELNSQQKANSELNLKELNEGKEILASFPRRVVLELTNDCNLRCIMCGRDEANFNKTVLNTELFRKFNDVFQNAEEVTLFGWGEPTIHPEFIDILKHIDSFPVRKYFVTNGTRLKFLKDALFDFHVDIMAVSLDGACAETNDRIRRGSSFVRIVSDLSSIVEEKRKRNLNYPYINFVFTVMRSNIHELPDLVRLASEIGLEEVKAVYLTVFTENLLGETLWGSDKTIRQNFDQAASLAQSLGIKIKLPHLPGEDPAKERFHKDCFVSWRDFYVGSDGYIRPCQSTSLKLFPVNKYNSFNEMWNSDEYQRFRSRVNNLENMPKECKRCYQSSHANWNRRDSFLQINNQYAPEWSIE